MMVESWQWGKKFHSFFALLIDCINIHQASSFHFILNEKSSACVSHISSSAGTLLISVNCQKAFKNFQFFHHLHQQRTRSSFNYYIFLHQGTGNIDEADAVKHWVSNKQTHIFHSQISLLSLDEQSLKVLMSLFRTKVKLSSSLNHFMTCDSGWCKKRRRTLKEEDDMNK